MKSCKTSLFCATRCQVKGRDLVRYKGIAVMSRHSARTAQNNRIQLHHSVQIFKIRLWIRTLHGIRVSLGLPSHDFFSTRSEPTEKSSGHKGPCSRVGKQGLEKAKTNHTWIWVPPEDIMNRRRAFSGGRRPSNTSSSFDLLNSPTNMYFRWYLRGNGTPRHALIRTLQLTRYVMGVKQFTRTAQH